MIFLDYNLYIGGDMKKENFGEDTKIIWTDKKRYFGMPISFTRYSLVEKEGSWIKLFLDAGFLSTRHEEVLVYRIFDISVRQTLGDKIFNVGSLYLYCKDESMEYFNIIRVKNPFKVRDIISDYIEKEREEKGFRIGEFHG